MYVPSTISYTLELPEELKGIYSTFHVSNLKKCFAEDDVVVSIDEIQLDKLHMIEEPVEVMDREVKRLKQSRIPIVKVRWNSQRGLKITWERDDQINKKYPHLFTNSKKLRHDQKWRKMKLFQGMQLIQKLSSYTSGHDELPPKQTPPETDKQSCTSLLLEIRGVKSPIDLKIYIDDGPSEIINNFRISDIYVGKWKEMMDVCPKGTRASRPLEEQDSVAKLNHVAKRKRKSDDDLQDCFNSTKRYKSSVQYSDLEVGTILNEPALGMILFNAQHKKDFITIEDIRKINHNMCMRFKKSSSGFNKTDEDNKRMLAVSSPRMYFCAPKEDIGVTEGIVDEELDDEIEMEYISEYVGLDHVGEEDVEIPNTGLNDTFLNKLVDGKFISDKDFKAKLDTKSSSSKNPEVEDSSVDDRFKVGVLATKGKQKVVEDISTPNSKSKSPKTPKTPNTKQITSKKSQSPKKGCSPKSPNARPNADDAQKGCSFRLWVGGELLTSMGRDANNQMFPMAWAVYSKQMWVDSYSHFVKPVDGSSLWVKSANLPPLPSKKRIMPGKPKKNRIKMDAEITNAEIVALVDIKEAKEREVRRKHAEKVLEEAKKKGFYRKRGTGGRRGPSERIAVKPA
nr:putative reverse transcriptase domain-containing protein [Tanacetum cinerariifolium]